ncbi:MAG: tryptophan synthase subunit alpha [Leptonema sp. (in: Bacteria)]|nr:tryptophan synthase subunit alpha [Leptonema sp. (in: bacteria)]
MKVAQESKLAAKLHQIQQSKQRSLYMPYLTLGDPSFDDSFNIVSAMIHGGADIIELGIPFSDPTADGPVIQRAMVRAMSAPNYSLNQVFETTSKIHSHFPDTALIYLVYMNLVMSEDALSFLTHAAKAGIQALVIPDLPFDSKEADHLGQLGASLGIELVGMIAPNTSNRRLKEIASKASGFIYYVTSLGVTGERSELPADLIERLDLVRSCSRVPIFAGFGISRPDQAASLASHVDGVIAGSVNHRFIEAEPSHAAEKIEKLTKEFVSVLGPRK